jgi:hypothetical protein
MRKPKKKGWMKLERRMFPGRRGYKSEGNGYLLISRNGMPLIPLAELRKVIKDNC